ncbi:hypothetical protein GCM10009117_22300 [Gangjinia marincola]|uniref:N-acetyltransferase domain-containing protein n=1 Tax=Gangjinia marincola TaxID=578463 RepID=A0ABN1MJL1_9FLAO
MIIRRGNLQDLPAIQELFKQTVRTVNANDYSAKQVKVWASSVEDLERLQNFFTIEEFYLAFDENKLVGFASLKGTDYFEKLFVHKDHQSKGIAKQLVDVI